MKKIYAILSAALVVLLLCIGFYAMFNMDEEAKKPSLTLGGLLDGSYGTGRQSYFSEGFPQTESLKNANTKLNSFYKFSGLSGEDEASLMLPMGNSAAQHGASLQQTEPPISSSDNDPSASSGNDEPIENSETDAPDKSTEATERNEPSDEQIEDVQNLGSALLIGTRAIEVPYADYDQIEKYSAAITSIADSLGSGVRTFSILVPNAAEFYTTKDYHTGNSSQSKMIAFGYENMGKNVHTVDAYTKLAAHTDEYIYFRTDHHWTQLGAYYAYTAFCETAGLTAEPLSKFEQGQHDNFVGSMYTFFSGYANSSVLLNNPDTLYYYRPFVDTGTSYYQDATLSVEYPIGCISYIGSDVGNKYLCYLGGDHPVTVIETDVEGPVCILIKESYGNAFAPWLTSHYSKIFVIDPREFNHDGAPSLDLAAFAREHNVDDCIILNYPMMISSGTYIARLESLTK